MFKKQLNHARYQDIAEFAGGVPKQYTYILFLSHIAQNFDNISLLCKFFYNCFIKKIFDIIQAISYFVLGQKQNKLEKLLQIPFYTIIIFGNLTKQRKNIKIIT